MDPQATFDRMVEALRDGDRLEFTMACSDLDSWVRRGGFMPDDASDYARGVLDAYRFLVLAVRPGEVE